MQRSFIFAVMLASIVLLSLSLIITRKDKRHLMQERNSLILKSDSLHIQLLESREMVTCLNGKVDSLLQKK